MSTQLYPVLNAVAPSWADLTCTFSVQGGTALDMIDIAGLNWESALEIGEQRGASGGIVIKRTSGANSDKGSASLYRSGWRLLQGKLADKAPLRGDRYRIGLVAVDFVGLWTPPGDSAIYKVELLGCRIMKRAGAHAEGADPDKIDVDLSIGEIVEYDADGRKIVLL